MCLTSLATPKKYNQTQASRNFKISQHAFDFYRENIGPFETEVFNIYEIEPIGIFDLRQILIDQAKTYQSEMKSEINVLVQILNPQHELKTFTTQSKVSRELMNYYQVNDYYIEIEKDLVLAVIEKCQGNPQLCISLVYQLLTVRYINI